jgi:hypothetical protein
VCVCACVCVCAGSHTYSAHALPCNPSHSCSNYLGRTGTAVDRLGRERWDIEQELRGAQERLAQMSHDAQRARDTADELAATKTAMLRCEEEIHELQCTVSQLQSAAVQCDQLQARNTAQELATTKRALERRVAEMDVRSAEVKAAKSSAADAVAKAERLSVKCSSLTAEAEAAAAERADLVSRLAASEAARSAAGGGLGDHHGAPAPARVVAALETARDRLNPPTKTANVGVQTDLAPRVREGGHGGAASGEVGVAPSVDSPLRWPMPTGERRGVAPCSPVSHPRLVNRLGNIIRDSGEKAVYCASPPMRLDRDRPAGFPPASKLQWDDVVSAASSPLAAPRNNNHHRGGGGGGGGGGDLRAQQQQPLRERSANVPPPPFAPLVPVLAQAEIQRDTAPPLCGSSNSIATSVQRPPAPAPPPPPHHPTTTTTGPRATVGSAEGRSSGPSGLNLVSKSSKRHDAARVQSDADVQALLEQVDQNLSRAKSRTLVLESAAKASSRHRRGGR